MYDSMCTVILLSVFFEQKRGIPLAPPLDPPLTFLQGGGLD